MSRFTNYGQRDTPWTTDGDVFFKGIDMVHDRGSLPPGYLARGENTRLREGPASTRPGMTYAADFNPAFANTIIGSGIFKNPNGDEVMLVATLNATYVWALQSGKDPVQINLVGGQNTGTVPGSIVNFVQAFDKVLLLRFPLATPLVWDGINANTFNVVTTGGPHTLIPNTAFGVPFMNRVLLYNPSFKTVPWRDQFIMTDPLDYTQYDNTISVFRMNAAQSDLIASILPYYDDSAIVFKTHSIMRERNFTIDPLLATQELVNGTIGSVGLRIPILLGQDVIFLSKPGGYYWISEVDEKRIGTPPRPASYLITPVIERINWPYTGLWGCSAALGDYVYFGLVLDPIGGACNAILVLNAVTREWESAPDWFEDPDTRINTLHVTLYDGEQQVFALDYNARRIYVLGIGLEDELNGDSIPVHYLAHTRGYAAADPGSFKRYHRAVLGLRTYAPDATITAIGDGHNDRKQLARVTKDRTQFYIHGHKRFDPTTDDPGEPRREDYSLEGDTAIEDFEDLPDGPLPFIPGTPLIFQGDKQQSLERFQVRKNARWISLEVENTSGQCDLLGAGVDATPIQEGVRTLR